jgi:PRA1 family protein 1
MGGQGYGHRRRSQQYYDEDYSPSDEDNYEAGTGMVRRAPNQMTLRDKEEALVASAMERIRRAQALGKTNVKLSRAEVDALDRLGRSQNPPPTPPIPAAVPKTAPKGKKAPAAKQKAIEPKKSGKSSKSASNSPKPKPKESRSRGQSAASSRSRGESREEAMVPYPISPDDPYAYPYAGRPGGPTSLQHEGRSGSSNSMRAQHHQSMPLPPYPQYPYYTHAYNSHPDVLYGPRPGSTNSRPPRPDPADPDWEPRARSSSSLVNFPLDQLPQQAVAGTGRALRFDPNDPRFGSPTSSRRVVSNPVPPSRRGRPQQDGYSPVDDDEVMQYRVDSNEDTTRSTSDSDDSGQGVQVDVEERSGGYAIQTRAQAAARSSGAGKAVAKRRR